MFEELRKKISNAVKGFVKKEENGIEARKRPAAPLESKKADGVQEGGMQHPLGKEEQRNTNVDINLSLGTKIKGVFLNSVRLNESDIDNFIEELRPALLQSDVSYDATEDFLNILKATLSGAKFKSSDIKRQMISSVRDSLLEMLNRSKPGINMIAKIRAMVAAGSVPVKILFLGPNGTGKTTTMGKIAVMLKKEGIGCVFSASDTFRAAAIEQTEHHAKSIGIPVIKSTYGADPASVAFDAIAYAKAHSIPVVLIDTAGRQETNKNLINEMMKMVRVAKPDITIFIGDSTAGNALAGQISEFSKHMGIDGIVLTKLDCDAKGGNAVSIAHTTGIPVLFFGTGESYDALIQYTPQFVVDSILPTAE